MLPRITVIGRPNVGKSSFFNMFIGHKIAIVADESGTTRDISEFEYKDKYTGEKYIISDSGGLDFSSKNDEIAKDIIERTNLAIDESDVLIWVLEYDKFTEDDEKILKILREKDFENVIVVANKADDQAKNLESYSLLAKVQYEDFFPVSTSHNSGFQELKNFLSKKFKKMGFDLSNDIDEEKDFVKLAIIGRPNVGKSSLINSIVGKDRVMVKDMSGTTRDSIDTKFEYEGEKFILIDTAGIRRLSKIGTRNVEQWSVLRTERSITRADIIAVVIDATEEIANTDFSVIRRVLEENKGLIIVFNKWDLVLKEATDKEKMMDKFIAYIKQEIDFVPRVSIIFSSAKDGKRVNEILDRAIEIKKERTKRIKTSLFNDFLEVMTSKHAPSGNKKSHNPKIFYGSQVDSNPPKFLISVNNASHFHFSYKRYLENKIRENFGFSGTPIIIQFKGKEKRYGKK